MNELCEDLVRRKKRKEKKRKKKERKKKSDYFAFLNRHCTKFCEFMRLKSCKYELLERATALDPQDVT
jgi:hypothetical protein